MGTWDHWVVYDIPPEIRRLAEGAAAPESAREGQNSWGRTGYGGPAPPPGKPHRYVFQLYALRERLGLGPGADKAAVRAAMVDKVLAEARLLGTYGR
jgi:Raf kinase inhibitor-like YbhB/YbcL family protein